MRDSIRLSLSLDPAFFHYCYIIIASLPLRADQELVINCIGRCLLCVDLWQYKMGIQILVQKLRANDCADHHMLQALQHRKWKSQ